MVDLGCASLFLFATQICCFPFKEMGNVVVELTDGAQSCHCVPAPLSSLSPLRCGSQLVPLSPYQHHEPPGRTHPACSLSLCRQATIATPPPPQFPPTCSKVDHITGKQPQHSCNSNATSEGQLKGQVSQTERQLKISRLFLFYSDNSVPTQDSWFSMTIFFFFFEMVEQEHFVIRVLHYS